MYYDKDEIKQYLTIEMVEELVRELGGDPKPAPFGFIAATICHNHPGEGSHKLYYYENTKLFRCYTGCDSTFDIFELISKIHNLDTVDPSWTLIKSVQYIAHKFGLQGSFDIDSEEFGTFFESQTFNKYEHIKIDPETIQTVHLKVYDDTILKRLCYPKIKDWIKEGITEQVLHFNQIGFCPSTDQITIPHFDQDGNFIGLRGRTLSKEDEKLHGKYRPMIIGGQMYNHALGLNLYNLNNSHDNIRRFGKAIIYEGEKSPMLYQSYFGIENDITVACCGSSISAYQIKLLMEAGAKEIIIAFDRQFKIRGDNEFQHLVRNLKTIQMKFGDYVNISFIFDKEDILEYKASPIDQGPDTFIRLFESRVIL